MKSFEGKVVIVTGASSGLGEAAALKFAREGATVVIAARREDKGQMVAQKVEALGVNGLFVKTDVTKQADVESLVDRTVTEFGKLDCAVNNAGIVGPIVVPLAEIEEQAWDEVMNTNLKAVWRCMKYEILAMLRQGKGSIVNISSIYGYKPSDIGHAAYCASKFGLIGLSKTAAVDYADQAIRVNVVCPGYTHSEMVDQAPSGFIKRVTNRHSARKRLGLAEETAEAIVWLCSDAPRFVNGAVIPVDGGETSRLY